LIRFALNLPKRKGEKDITTVSKTAHKSKKLAFARVFIKSSPLKYKYTKIL
jgi:hypothetical protein